MGRAEFPAIPEGLTRGIEEGSLDATVDVDVRPPSLCPQGSGGSLQ